MKKKSQFYWSSLSVGISGLAFIFANASLSRKIEHELLSTTVLHKAPADIFAAAQAREPFQKTVIQSNQIEKPLLAWPSAWKANHVIRTIPDNSLLASSVGLTVWKDGSVSYSAETDVARESFQASAQGVFDYKFGTTRINTRSRGEIAPYILDGFCRTLYHAAAKDTVNVRQHDLNQAYLRLCGPRQ